MPDIAPDMERNSSRMDQDPPRPPRQGKSIMAMASDGSGDKPDSINMSNPAVQVMAAMGAARQALMKLASMLPTLSAGIQQMVTGLEQVVPQQVADMVAGNPPGSGGSGMGAPQANASPTAPPVQTGMP
jgi:hypothetical protein